MSSAAHKHSTPMRPKDNDSDSHTESSEEEISPVVQQVSRYKLLYGFQALSPVSSLIQMSHFIYVILCDVSLVRLCSWAAVPPGIQVIAVSLILPALRRARGNQQLYGSESEYVPGMSRAAEEFVTPKMEGLPRKYCK
ncbi:hypothetical protein K438DRAFT_1779382 [Mycena galopus ATCC 62051]|nr:hypothetical protein K438DRAFT_1779382 [Mycena galopus ATCC 62051]